MWVWTSQEVTVFLSASCWEESAPRLTQMVVSWLCSLLAIGQSPQFFTTWASPIGNNMREGSSCESQRQDWQSFITIAVTHSSGHTGRPAEMGEDQLHEAVSARRRVGCSGATLELAPPKDWSIDLIYCHFKEDFGIFFSTNTAPISQSWSHLFRIVNGLACLQRAGVSDSEAVASECPVGWACRGRKPKKTHKQMFFSKIKPTFVSFHRGFCWCSWLFGGIKTLLALFSEVRIIRKFPVTYFQLHIEV